MNCPLVAAKTYFVTGIGTMERNGIMIVKYVNAIYVIYPFARHGVSCAYFTKLMKNKICSGKGTLSVLAEGSI
jgi:hypothetical protein